MAREIAKKVKNATLYADGTITIYNVRASYPHVDKKWAKKPDKETPKFSIVGILPNDTHAEARKLLLDECDRILKEAKVPKIKADLKFVRDGDLAAKSEYEGAWTVNASEAKRPAVLNPDKSEMEIDEIADTIQPGCRIDLLIEPWWQDNEHGQRINASLRGVRYLRMVEGEEIGEGGMDTQDVIDSFDDDEEGGFGSGDDFGGL